MLNPESFIGKAHQLFTSNLSLNELAQELTTILERPIRYHEITADQFMEESVNREGAVSQEGKDHLISLWESFLNLNRDKVFMARMAKGHGVFKMMTGESPTPLVEWLKRNQTAIEGDSNFQSSVKRVNA